MLRLVLLILGGAASFACSALRPGVRIVCNADCGSGACFASEAECVEILRQCEARPDASACVAAYVHWNRPGNCAVAVEPQVDVSTPSSWPAVAVSSASVGVVVLAAWAVIRNRSSPKSTPVALYFSRSLDPADSPFSPHMSDSRLDDESSYTEDIFLRLEDFKDVPL